MKQQYSLGATAGGLLQLELSHLIKQLRQRAASDRDTQRVMMLDSSAPKGHRLAQELAHMRRALVATIARMLAPEGLACT